MKLPIWLFFLAATFSCARSERMEIHGTVLSYRTDGYTEASSLVDDTGMPPGNFDLAYVVIDGPSPLDGILLPIILHRDHPMSKLLQRSPAVVFSLKDGSLDGDGYIVALSIDDVVGLRAEDSKSPPGYFDSPLAAALQRRLPRVVEFSGTVEEMALVTEGERHVSILVSEAGRKKVELRLFEPQQIRNLTKAGNIVGRTITFVSYARLFDSIAAGGVTELRDENIFKVRLGPPRAESTGSR